MNLTEWNEKKASITKLHVILATLFLVDEFLYSIFKSFLTFAQVK